MLRKYSNIGIIYEYFSATTKRALKYVKNITKCFKYFKDTFNQTQQHFRVNYSTSLQYFDFSKLLLFSLRRLIQIT